MDAAALVPASLPVVPSNRISNTLVNDPELDTTAYDTQSQPVVLVMPAGRVLVAYLDTGSLLGWTPHFNGWSLSTDGGATFVDRGTLPGGPSGLADGYELSGAYDSLSGSAFVAADHLGRQDTILVYRSEDKGGSFLAPVPAFPMGDYWLDFPTIAVDSTGGAGQGQVYVMARDGMDWSSGVLVTASSDGGRTFPTSAIRQLTAGYGSFCRLLVAADGTVHAFWYAEGSYPPALAVRSSHDHGNTFAAARRVATLQIGYYGSLPIEFSSTVHPAVAAHPLDPDLLVVAYADTVPGFDRADIFLVTSEDGGVTWSAPIRVNADVGTNDQFSPAVAFSADGSRLFVGWYDRRRDPRNWEIEYWGRIAKVVGRRLEFGPDFPVSTAAFPPVYAQDPGWSWSMSDNEQVGSDRDFFYVAWADTRNADVAHPHQHDIRLAKIPKDGPGPILEPAGASFVSGSCETQNRGPDPGETVVESLCVANWGTLPSVELIGQLQERGGVSNPGPPRSFGVLPGQGAVSCQDFGFTVDPSLSCGTPLVMALALTDASGPVGELSFTERVGETGTATYGPFANDSAVYIPPFGPASPYPSSIDVAGVPTEVERIQISILGFGHENPSGVSMQLQRPTGGALDFMSLTGGDWAVADVDLTLDDDAENWLPRHAPLQSGLWRPTVFEGSFFDPPANPDPPNAAPFAVASLRSEFGGTNPDGAWNLFIVNHDESLAGQLDRGWSMSFEKSAFSCRCFGPFFAGDFEVGDTSQWDAAVGLAAGSAR